MERRENGNNVHELPAVIQWGSVPNYLKTFFNWLPQSCIQSCSNMSVFALFLYWCFNIDVTMCSALASPVLLYNVLQINWLSPDLKLSVKVVFGGFRAKYSQTRPCPSWCDMKCFGTSFVFRFELLFGFCPMTAEIFFNWPPVTPSSSVSRSSFLFFFF